MEYSKAQKMEVHAHTHTPRKKWTHYFWEFLMLFFAVTLGFFVENQREHYVEHLREKQYINSLYNDIKFDTAAVSVTIEQKKWMLSKLDSLHTILALTDLSGQNEQLYYLERFLTKNETFDAQDVTYQQLKSSGNFRYIRNIDLYKKVSSYYNFYYRYQTLIESQFENINNLSQMESILYNGNDLSSLNNTNPKTFYELFLRPQTKLHPVAMDKQALNYLAIKVGNAKFLQENCLFFLRGLGHEGATLLKELKEEYHLKEDNR